MLENTAPYHVIDRSSSEIKQLAQFGENNCVVDWRYGVQLLELTLLSLALQRGLLKLTFGCSSSLAGIVMAVYLSITIEVLGFLGELSLCLWLLVIGVNVERWKQQASAARSSDGASGNTPV